ncbi:MAG: TIGR04211 family SH3 domain-containing protein [Gammaproteobacteria bacterium]|nr:TIGR04211 family SH3 domain-containing protein [Gammaproteobacteria bacterium]
MKIIEKVFTVKSYLLTAILLISSGLVQAENIQYVSDQLRITLRTGQGNTYQIIKTLDSGTKLVVLETTETGYAHVRLEDGTEGWVRTQYLSEEPIARITLASTEKKLERLQSQNIKLREEVDNLRKRSRELSSEQSSLSSKLKTSETELARLSEVAAKPILLDKENRELQQRNIAQEKELQMVAQENQVLKDRSQREWFLAGAGVLLGGILLGLLIPKIRWQKKSNW